MQPRPLYQVSPTTTYEDWLRTKRVPELRSQIIGLKKDPLSTAQQIQEKEDLLVKAWKNLGVKSNIKPEDIISEKQLFHTATDYKYLKSTPSRKVQEKVSTSLLENIKNRWMSLSPRAKLGVGVGLGLSGFMFSGKDDEYNVIEGLRHGGLAQGIRRSHTDFGSGWQGSNLGFSVIGPGMLEVNDALFERTSGLSDGSKTGYMDSLIILAKRAGYDSQISSVLAQFHKSGLRRGFIVREGLSESEKEATIRHESIHMFMPLEVEKKLEVLSNKIAKEKNVESRWWINKPSHLLGEVAAYQAEDSKFLTKERAPLMVELQKEYQDIVDLSIAAAETNISRFKKGFSLQTSNKAFNKAFNEIEALHPGSEGIGAQSIRQHSDFGSGWQGRDEENRVTSSYVFPSIAGAVGAAAGYSLVYPWAYRDVDTSQYPRLESLRRAGKKGFKMITPHITLDPEEQAKRGMSKLQRFSAGLMWKELEPSKIRELKDFEGVAYVQSGEYKDKPITPKFANWGYWDVGEDKFTTWEHLKTRGAQDLHVETILGSDFYGDKGLTKQGRTFLEEAGGTSGLVVKRRASARGRGVWLDASKLPENIAEELYRKPNEFVLQKKIDLAEEFRVVTVGDKPIETTYRFGSPKARKLAKFLGFETMKEMQDKTKFTKSPFEVIQPVLNRDLRSKIETFATKAAKELPYEIGALDIGLTKSGELKLIEAQRQFGNISNPVVSRRIKQIITGKTGALGAVAAIGGGISAFGLTNLFSAKDNEYNTIEGLHPGSDGLGAQSIRKNTDFGSGWRGLFVNREELAAAGVSTYEEYEAKRINKASKKINQLLGRDMSHIYQARENWFDNTLGGKIYNYIEGLHPGSEGLGTETLRMYSDFGSRWDPLKTMAKAIYNSDDAYSKMLKSKEFQSALEGGTRLKELGQGMYGTASLMETTFKGQKFKYVRKDIHGIENPFLEPISEAKRVQALKSEFSIMGEVSDGIAPSPYGFSEKKNQMFMELMPGKPVEALTEELSPKVIKEIESEIEAVASKGVYNPDIHAGNIMYDVPSGKVSWIDWGMAKTQTSPDIAKMKQAFSEKTVKVNQEIASRQQKVATQESEGFFDDWSFNNEPAIKAQKIKSKQNFNQISQEAVGLGFKSAHNAGKRHSKFASTDDFF